MLETQFVTTSATREIFEAIINLSEKKKFIAAMKATNFFISFYSLIILRPYELQ